MFVIGTRPESVKRTLTIQGYEMEVTDTGGRYPKVRPTDVTRTYRDVPYLAKYAPTRTVRLPRGYLINVPDPAIVDRIRDHGIVVERLVAPATVEVEAFSVSKLTGSAFSDQGHFTSDGRGHVPDEGGDLSRRELLRQHGAAAGQRGGAVAGAGKPRRAGHVELPRPLSRVPVDSAAVESPVYKLH